MIHILQIIFRLYFALLTCSLIKVSCLALGCKTFAIYDPQTEVFSLVKPSQVLFLVLSWNPLWLVYKSWHATEKKIKITVPKLPWVSETCLRIFLVITFVMYDVETSWIHSDFWLHSSLKHVPIRDGICREFEIFWKVTGFIYILSAH